MATIRPLQKIQYLQVEKDGHKLVDAEIITEMAVTLTLNGEPWLSFMCTPVDLEALAIGFLYNEGLVDSRDEIADVRLCSTGDNVDVWLNHSVEKPGFWLRTSGCTGGMTAIQNDSPDSASSGDQQEILDHAGLADLSNLDTNGVKLSLHQVTKLIDLFLGAQTLYQQSGGVHTSGLSDGKKIRVLTEDIGRHNTLDKISGLCLLNGIHFKRRILLTTGRISSEMLQKASRLQASIVISRTSPSSLSIQMAERRGITLIGYSRRTSFRVYSHPERIQLPSKVAISIQNEF
jgi:FdhD protein